MKQKWNKIKDIMSWVLLAAMICMLVFTCYSSYQAKKTGEPFFVFGYRPVLVLTGSMEPYMMTHGLALTKEVTSLDALEVGDVITYCVESESGNLLRITHRIIALDNGNIYTKGDNNQVDDGYPLTIDNVESEVVGVFNGTAWLVQKWQSGTSGKVMLIAFASAIILLCYALKAWRNAKKDDESETAAEENTAAVIESNIKNEQGSEPPAQP